MHNFTYRTFSEVKLHTSSRAPRVLPKVTPSSEKSSPKKHGNLSRLAEISRNMRTKKHFLDCPNTAVGLKKSGLADSSPTAFTWRWQNKSRYARAPLDLQSVHLPDTHDTNEEESLRWPTWTYSDWQCASPILTSPCLRKWKVWRQAREVG